MSTAVAKVEALEEEKASLAARAVEEAKKARELAAALEAAEEAKAAAASREPAAAAEASAARAEVRRWRRLLPPTTRRREVQRALGQGCQDAGRHGAASRRAVGQALRAEASGDRR